MRLNCHFLAHLSRIREYYCYSLEIQLNRFQDKIKILKSAQISNVCFCFVLFFGGGCRGSSTYSGIYIKCYPLRKNNCFHSYSLYLMLLFFNKRRISRVQILLFDPIQKYQGTTVILIRMHIYCTLILAKNADQNVNNEHTYIQIRVCACVFRQRDAFIWLGEEDNYA